MRTLLTLLAACASAMAADLSTTAQTNGLRGTLYFTDTDVFGTRSNGFGMPHFRPIAKIKRGVWFFPAVIFAGPGLGPDGTADVRLSLALHNPDGSVRQQIDNIVVTRERFASSDKRFHLAQDTQGVCISPDDPVGTYTLVATLTDKVNRVAFSLGRQFTIDK